MKKIFSVLIGSFICLNLVGCELTPLFSDKNDSSAIIQDEVELLEPVNAPIQTAVAEIRDISKITVYEAEVNPYVTQLSFQREGKFLNYYVTLGETVKQGQILAGTDQESEEEALLELQEKLDNIKADYEKAIAALQVSLSICDLEMEVLWEEVKTLSGADYTKKCVEIGKKDQEIRKIQLTMEQAQETQLFEETRLQAQIEEATENLGNNNIYAPYDGVVVSVVDLDRGTYVDKDQTILAIADVSQKIINCEYISQSTVNKGYECYGLVNGERYTIDYQPYDKATYLALEMQEETPVSTFLVTDGNENIQAGDSGVVVLITNSKKQVLTLPNTAIYKDSISSYVYLSVDGKKMKTQIKTGEKDDIYTEILSGVQEGDVVYAAD